MNWFTRSGVRISSRKHEEQCAKVREKILLSASRKVRVEGKQHAAVRVAEGARKVQEITELLKTVIAAAQRGNVA